MPLFPASSVVLLPHAIIRLHIFEERFKRMVEDVLESTGQIALAVHASRLAEESGDPMPALRPGVCLGRVLDYDRLPDGRFHITLQGMCRSRIRYELPLTADCPYRQAMLEPVGLDEIDESVLTPTRMRLTELLKLEPLSSELREAPSFVQHMEDSAIPTSVLLELLATVFISDPEVKYRILEDEHARARGRMIERELRSLAELLRKAEAQRRIEWPKGCSWN